jgi:hypothetical protein
MLSILLFLIGLFELYGYEPRCTIVYCNNLGLITTVLSPLKCTMWYQNETIPSEWDITQYHSFTSIVLD